MELTPLYYTSLLGCTGADVRNIVNIGQLISARANETVVSIDHLSDALDRITFGLVKKSPIMKARKLNALYFVAFIPVFPSSSPSQPPIGGRKTVHSHS